MAWVICLPSAPEVANGIELFGTTDRLIIHPMAAVLAAGSHTDMPARPCGVVTQVDGRNCPKPEAPLRLRALGSPPLSLAMMHSTPGRRHRSPAPLVNSTPTAAEFSLMATHGWTQVRPRVRRQPMHGLRIQRTAQVALIDASRGGSGRDVVRLSVQADRRAGDRGDHYASHEAGDKARHQLPLLNATMISSKSSPQNIRYTWLVSSLRKLTRPPFQPRQSWRRSTRSSS
jgi:hypothetical protein